MTRDAWLSFLPPVLAAAALRIFVAVQMVFRPDGSDSPVLFQEGAIGLALLFGLPGVFVFGLIRLLTSRKAGRTLAMIGGSLAISAAILLMPLGEPYLRLYLNQQRYDAVAAQRADAPTMVFDWGDSPRAAPFVIGHVKEYLVIARASAVATLDRYVGQEIGSWGDDRMDVDGLLSSGWDANDVIRRFKLHHLDACSMQVSHLRGPYYYVADWC
jgi:hypothetical protein